MDITATFFNNLNPDVREFLISEGVQVPKRLPTETNHKGNQRLFLVRKAAAEKEKKIRTIKEAVKPLFRGPHHRTFMRISRVEPPIKTADLSSSSKSE